LLSQLERDDRVHQPLLGAVVQIPHHPAAGLVSGGEHTRPRGQELVTAVGVGDRGADQVREVRDARLGVWRQWLSLLGVDREGAPQSALHHDRATDRRAHAEHVADDRCHRSGNARLEA
jgi:hypothetical protein